MKCSVEWRFDSMKTWFKKTWVYIAIAISIIAFCFFKQFLNDNGQTLMVLITAIYVIATINISNANIKSAEATNDQIKESARQFEETRRLQVIPYLQLGFTENKVNDVVPCTFLEMRNEKCDSTTFQAFFSLKNIGLGIAHNTSIKVTTRYKKDDTFPTFDIVMPPNCEKSTLVHFNVEKCEDTPGRCEDIYIKFKYDDLLGNTYQQEAHLLMVVQPGRAHLLQAVRMSSPQLILKKE